MARLTSLLIALVIAVWALVVEANPYPQDPSQTVVQWQDPAIMPSPAAPIAPPAVPPPAAFTPEAAPKTGDSGHELLIATRQLSAAFAIGGLLLAGVGFTFCFMGRRSYTPTMFLSGFFTFAIIVFVTFQILQRRWRSFGPYADWIYLISMTTSALLGGWLFLRIHQLGCIAVGMLLGLTWGIIILFTGVGGNLDENSHLTILIVLTTALGAAVFFMEHLIIILGTANVGAFAIITGVDMLARTGFVEVLGRCLSGPTPPKSGQVPGPAWGVMAVGLVIAMTGWYVQTRPGPPSPPSEWNPAYWLFGADFPPPGPPTWFKMPPNVAQAREAPPAAAPAKNKCLPLASPSSPAVLHALVDSNESDGSLMDPDLHFIHASLIASVQAAKDASKSGAGRLEFGDPMLAKFIESRDRFHEAVRSFREILMESREASGRDEKMACREELILLHRDIQTKEAMLQKYLQRSQSWYSLLNSHQKTNQTVLDRTYRNPDLVPPTMEQAMKSGDLPIPSAEEDDISPPAKPMAAVMNLTAEEEIVSSPDDELPLAKLMEMKTEDDNETKKEEDVVIEDVKEDVKEEEKEPEPEPEPFESGSHEMTRNFCIFTLDDTALTADTSKLKHWHVCSKTPDLRHAIMNNGVSCSNQRRCEGCQELDCRTYKGVSEPYPFVPVVNLTLRENQDYRKNDMISSTKWGVLLLTIAALSSVKAVSERHLCSTNPSSPTPCDAGLTCVLFDPKSPDATGICRPTLPEKAQCAVGSYSLGICGPGLICDPDDVGTGPHVRYVVYGTCVKGAVKDGWWKRDGSSRRRRRALRPGVRRVVLSTVTAAAATTTPPSNPVIPIIGRKPNTNNFVPFIPIVRPTTPSEQSEENFDEVEGAVEEEGH
ncbi:hypothetical protein HDU67_006975 [Dinochytrium kinnereticum]|nr:hypothetical protein HDU67_006975 [Dinochytrium kinnereticum]